MASFIFSFVLMLAVVGGLSQWMIRRDREQRERRTTDARNHR
jgi:putative effector of murein hydrolase LrgA (UPF0299 family)